MNWSILSPSLETICKKIHNLFVYQPTSVYTHSSCIHHTYFSHYPQLHSPPNSVNTFLSPPLSFKPILLTHHHAPPGQAKNGYAPVLAHSSITNTLIYHTHYQQPKPITILTSPLFQYSLKPLFSLPSITHSTIHSPLVYFSSSHIHEVPCAQSPSSHHPSNLHTPTHPSPLHYDSPLHTSPRLTHVVYMHPMVVMLSTVHPCSSYVVRMHPMVTMLTTTHPCSPHAVCMHPMAAMLTIAHPCNLYIHSHSPHNSPCSRTSLKTHPHSPHLHHVVAPHHNSLTSHSHNPHSSPCRRTSSQLTHTAHTTHLCSCISSKLTHTAHYTVTPLSKLTHTASTHYHAAHMLTFNSLTSIPHHHATHMLTFSSPMASQLHHAAAPHHMQPTYTNLLPTTHIQLKVSIRPPSNAPCRGHIPFFLF